MIRKIKGRRASGTPEQKRKRRRKRIAIGAGLLAVVLGTFAVRAVFFSKEKAPSVPVSAARKQDITAQMDAGGMVISLREKTYYSPVNADILRYDLKVGSAVKRGELLVAFDTESLERDNRRAELSAASSIGTNDDTVQKSRRLKSEAAVAKDQIASIEANIDKYKQYIRDLNAAISERSRALAGGDVSGDVSDAAGQAGAGEISAALAAAEKKEALESAGERCRAEIDSLEVEMSRAQFDDDGTTAAILQRQIDTRREQLQGNESEIEELRERMGAYADMSASDLEAALTEATASSGIHADPSSDDDIARWQLDLSDAQEELAELQSSLAEKKARAEAGDDADMTEGAKRAMDSGNDLARLESATAAELLEEGRRGIHAEFSGIVTKADLGQGTPATQGMELVTVASTEEIAVRATVSKYDYSDLEKGQQAAIEIGSYTYDGTVGDISRIAETNEKDTPVTTCEVLLEHPDEHVVLGMEARVNIVTSRKSNVLTVPVEAVNTGREGTFCYVVEGGRVARREVNAGVRSAEGVEILSGLEEGERVITRLPDGVEEGMEVHPEETDSSDDSREGAS